MKKKRKVLLTRHVSLVLLVLLLCNLFCVAHGNNSDKCETVRPIWNKRSGQSCIQLSRVPILMQIKEARNVNKDANKKAENANKNANKLWKSGVKLPLGVTKNEFSLCFL